MDRLKRTVVATLTALVAASTALAQGQPPEPGSRFAAEDWPLAGGDWTSSRYSMLDQISTDTIGRLGGAWVTRLAGGGSSRSTPVVKDGVLYLTAGASVLAIDGATGETRWRWQAEDAASRMAPSWQGVGLNDDLVFVGLRSVQVAAPPAGHRRAGVGDDGREHSRGRGRDGHHGAHPCGGQGVRGRGQRRQRGAGTGRGGRRGDRRGRLDILRHPASRRVRPRHVAAGLRHLGGRGRRRLAGGDRRSGAGTGLLRDRQSGADVRRRDPRGRQPLRGLRAGPRHGDRRAPLALPGGAARHLGRRHRHPHAALRRGDGRPACARAWPPSGPTATCSCSTGRPASRSSRSSNGRCRRTRASAPPTPSRSRWARSASFPTARTGAIGCRRRSS